MSFRSITLVAAACALTCGCVTLLPKAVPATLYKLSVDIPPVDRPATAPVVNVLRGPTTFPRMASGDEIVTVTGAEVASIAGARWAAPAQIMFDEAMVASFDASTKVHLSTRGAPSPADRVLRVEVRTFEARYSATPKSAPTVVIEIKASLTDPTKPGVVREQAFRAEVPAAENRVSLIVPAYDTALTKVLGDLVKWTETTP